MSAKQQAALQRLQMKAGKKKDTYSPPDDGSSIKTFNNNFADFFQDFVRNSSILPFGPLIGRKSWSQLIENCTRIHMNQTSSKSELPGGDSDHFLEIQNWRKFSIRCPYH